MDLSGKTINRYRIIKRLGQGGMAVVYLAFDTRLEREVAIKIIRKENILPSQMEQFLQRFEQEAKTQSKFDHPNIVQVYDFGEYEGSPYLVMAYQPGGTLKDLTGSPIPYSQAAQLLAPIADALTYAHARDVLHRDVKPANILLNEDYNCKLTDFGIAKLLGNIDGNTLTGTGVGVGTPQYMAPEQWTGQPEKATDIYALGVVFYELVTGHKPYDADTPAALLVIQATEPLRRPTEYVPDLPLYIEKVLYKALAPKPEDRFESMAEFAAVLETLSYEKPHDHSTMVEPSSWDDVSLPPTKIENGMQTPTRVEKSLSNTDFGIQPEPKDNSKLLYWGLGIAGVIGFIGIMAMIAVLLFRDRTPVADNIVPTTPVAEAVLPTVDDAEFIPDVPLLTDTPMPTYTSLPTYTPFPTNTFVPTTPPTATVPPTRTPTEVPKDPMFTASEDMFCRDGPTVNSEDHWVVYQGMTYPVLARWYQNDWILVGMDDPGTRTKCCWVGGDGSLNVSFSSIPAIDFLPDRMSCDGLD